MGKYAYLSIVILGLLLPVSSNAGPLKELFPNQFTGEGESLLCGPTPREVRCPNEYFLINFFNTPIQAVHEDGSKFQWSDSVSGGITPKQRLLLYIVAQLQLFGQPFREIDGFNYSVFLDASDACKKYYRFPSYQEGLHGAADRYTTGISPAPVIKDENCPGKHFEAFRRFPASILASAINTVYPYIDRAFDSDKNIRKLQKIFLLLQTRRTDVGLKTIEDLINDSKIDDYVEANYPRESFPHLAFMKSSDGILPASKVIRESLGSTDLYVFRGNVEEMAYDEEESGARKQATFIFGDEIRLGNGAVLYIDWARKSADAADRDGADVVFVANKFVVGESTVPPDSDDLFGPALPYPHALLFSPGKLGDTIDEKTPAGRAGRFIAVAPKFSISQQALQSLRIAYSFFGRVLTDDGRLPLVIDTELANACFAGLSENNPHVASALVSAKNGIVMDAFIPQWERAIEWEMENKPVSILHRFVYVNPSRTVAPELRWGGHKGFYPASGTLARLNALTEFESSLVPAAALDAWLVRSLQDTRLALNRARVRKDKQGIVDALRRIQTVSENFYPVSGAGLDPFNTAVEHLIAERDKAGDLFAFSSVDVLLSGKTLGRALLLTSGASLDSFILPTDALLRVTDQGGHAYVGRIQFEGDGKSSSVIFRFAVRLSVDGRLEQGARQVLSVQGGKLLGAFKDWSFELKKPELPGLTTFKSTAISNDTAEVEIGISPDEANEFLWRISTIPGIPLKIEWSARASPQTKGDYTIYVSNLIRDTNELTTIGSKVSNNSDEPLVVEYVDLGERHFETFDTPILIPAKSDVTLKLSPFNNAGSLSVGPGGVRRVPSNSVDISRNYFILNSGSIVKSISVENLLPANDPKLGALRYVEVNCVVVGVTDSRKLTYGPYRLSPNGATGSDVRIDIIRAPQDEVSLQVSGSAVYQEGSILVMRPLVSAESTIRVGRENF